MRTTIKPFNPYKGMPKALKIGNYRFPVVLLEPGAAQASNAHGSMCPVEQTIRISPGQNPQNLADTFIHEVIHAIHFHFELLGDESPEELITTFTAHGLCQLWQDNPMAMAWWASINSHFG